MEQNQAFVRLLPDLGQAGCSATVVSSPVGKPFCWKNHRVLLILLLECRENPPPLQLCYRVFLTAYTLVSLGYLKNLFSKEIIRIRPPSLFMYNTHMQSVLCFSINIFYYIYVFCCCACTCAQVPTHTQIHNCSMQYF